MMNNIVTPCGTDYILIKANADTINYKQLQDLNTVGYLHSLGEMALHFGPIDD